MSLDRRELVPGAFYWVLPVLDPDTDEAWENEPQPARFISCDADGRNERWHYLNIDDASEWPVRWIGPRIAR